MALLQAEFRSQTLKRSVAFQVILPMENFEGPYPTLYLLHGLTENSNAWLHHTRIRMWAVTREMLPLSHKREETYIAGLSMGGYGACRNGLKYCDTFGKAAVLSGAVHFFECPREWVRTQGNTIGELQNIGDLDAMENTDRNPRYLMRRIRDRNQADGCNWFPDFYVACGLQDPLLDANRSVAEAIPSREKNT